MGTKQIVVEQDLDRQFHQECVRRGVTLRLATEKLIRDALGQDPDTKDIEHVTPAAVGGPMLRYGEDASDDRVVPAPLSVRVHGDADGW